MKLHKLDVHRIHAGLWYFCRTCLIPHFPQSLFHDVAPVYQSVFLHSASPCVHCDRACRWPSLEGKGLDPCECLTERAASCRADQLDSRLSNSGTWALTGTGAHTNRHARARTHTVKSLLLWFPLPLLNWRAAVCESPHMWRTCGKDGHSFALFHHYMNTVKSQLCESNKDFF